MPRNHYFNNYAHNLIGFFLAIMSLSFKASEKIVYYCEQDQMSIIDSKFIVDKYNKLSRTQRLISNFKINIQKEIIFYQELDPNLSEETALNDLNNNFHIQVNKNKDNYIKAIDFRGKEMYLFKEDEKIKLILIDFKNKPKSAHFSIAKCIEF